MSGPYLVPGAHVVYRDPARYLTGQPDHTDIYRVLNVTARVELVHPVTGQHVVADRDYVRVIDPTAVMADIDTHLGGQGYLPQPTAWRPALRAVPSRALTA